jgi:cobalt-zinc-cadmium efflux system outer membrane protein
VKRTSIYICWLWFACVGAHAQSGPQQPFHKTLGTQLSIERATELALRNNPEIKTAVRRVTLADTKTLTAGSLDDPMFMYRDWGTPLKQPWDLNQAQHMFMFQQTFPGEGKRLARTRLGKDNAEVGRSELESLRQDISARVRKSFVDLLRNADEMRLHEKQAALLRDALATATSKYSVGKAPQADVLRAQIVQTKLVDHLIQLEQERDLARAELNTLMGIDPAAPLEIAGEYRHFETPLSIVELEKTAIDHRPELAELRKQVKVGEDEIREIKQADVATEISRDELDARRAVVFLEIESALIRVRSAQRSMKLYRDTLTPQAEATFQAALAAYQNDRSDFLNLIDSQNMLLDVQTSYFKSAAEIDARLADLERAIGAPLTSNSADSFDREDK